jgi:uncharacterized C2H2 Zn-finger protein
MSQPRPTDLRTIRPHCPNGKVSYATRRLGRKAVAELAAHGIVVSLYRCPLCDLLHTTRQSYKRRIWWQERRHHES